MLWNDALYYLENNINTKIKRTDWGYSQNAFIELDEFYGDICFILNNRNLYFTKEIYHLTYTDIKSNNWIIY